MLRKKRREEQQEQDKREKEEAEIREMTFKPNLNVKTQRLAEQRQERSNSNFLGREQKFIQDRENRLNQKINEKLNTEASELTFQPVTNNL